MYKYLEAPEMLGDSGGDYSKYSHRLFLAGGITGVRNWQADVANALTDLDLLVMNPRRANFEQFKDEAGHAESVKQIKWEHVHLMIASQIVFWFSNETLQPIALFELGKMLALNRGMCSLYSEKERVIFVGIHPEYQRKFDMEVQIPLMDKDLVIVNKIEDLILQVRNYNKVLTRKA